MLRRNFWLKAVLGCLTVIPLSLGQIADGFQSGRERGNANKTSRGGSGQAGPGNSPSRGGGIQSPTTGNSARFGSGTVHVPSRSRGSSPQGNAQSQFPAARRAPTFSTPSFRGVPGNSSSVRNQLQGNRPQFGTNSGRPSVRVPAAGRPDIGRSDAGRREIDRTGINRNTIDRSGLGRVGVDTRGFGGTGIRLPGQINAPRTNIRSGVNRYSGSGYGDNYLRLGNSRNRIGVGGLGSNSLRIGGRNINLVGSGYRPSYHRHNFYRGYWNNNYGGGWGYPGGNYGYGNYGYGGFRSYRPLGWGLGLWGTGLLAYNSGYLGYVNPYYNGYAGYNYSQPIQIVYSTPTTVIADTTATPTATDAGLNAAVTAFQQQDYDRALDLVNQEITRTPGDSVLHEFRSLVLFAKADYQQAAATIHSVLAVGPGWNWTTLSNVYGDVSRYTPHLRALETAVRSQPQDGASRFLLAYHYMTAGHTDAASRQLQQVVTLLPSDRVAAEMLRMISPAKDDDSNSAPPEPLSAAATADVNIDPAGLVGTWAASNNEGSQFALSLTNDSTFTWKHSGKDQRSQEFVGKYTLEGQVLALEGTDGGSLVAAVTPDTAGNFNFKLLGAPDEDPGLNFSR